MLIWGRTLSNYGHSIDFLGFLNLRRNQKIVNYLLSLQLVAERLGKQGRPSRDLSHLEWGLCIYLLVHIAHLVEKAEKLLLLLFLDLNVLRSFCLCCNKLLKIFCINWNILAIIVGLGRLLLREKSTL